MSMTFETREDEFDAIAAKFQIGRLVDVDIVTCDPQRIRIALATQWKLVTIADHTGFVMNVTFRPDTGEATIRLRHSGPPTCDCAESLAR